MLQCFMQQFWGGHCNFEVVGNVGYKVAGRTRCTIVHNKATACVHPWYYVIILLAK